MASRTTCTIAPNSRRSHACTWGTAIVLALSFFATDVFADELARCTAAAEKGQQLRKSGKLRDARTAFSQCSSDTCHALVRGDCRRWMQEVEHDLPSIVIRATDSRGNDVSDVTVKIDGGDEEPIGGAPRPLDPGDHVLALQGPDEATGHASIVVSRGEHAREVVVLMTRPAPLPTVASSSSAAPPPPSHATESHATWVPWALYGVAAVGVVGFTVLGLSAKSRADDLRSTCAPRCATSDVDAAKTKAEVADLSLALGIVSAGVATVWLLGSTDAPVTATASRHGAFARWETSF